MTRCLVPLLALSAFATPALAGDRHYAVEDFDRIVAEGPYVVHLVTGRTTSVVAHGSREALDRMSLDVQGQMLRIRRNRAAWSGGTGADPGIVTIDLVTRSVRSVRLIGPVRFDADAVRGLRVEFSVEGSGTLHATRLAADALSLALLGSGRLDLAGTAGTLSGKLSVNDSEKGGATSFKSLRVQFHDQCWIQRDSDGRCTVRVGQLDLRRADALGHRCAGTGVARHQQVDIPFGIAALR